MDKLTEKNRGTVYLHSNRTECLQLCVPKQNLSIVNIKR